MELQYEMIEVSKQIIKRTSDYKLNLTRVISREAAAALMCKLGCFTELEQSSALANVPTDLKITISVNPRIFLFQLIFLND